MDLTRNEFSLFNNNSKKQLLFKDGVLVSVKAFVKKKISLYRIYSYYVEVVEEGAKLVRINPISLKQASAINSILSDLN